MNVLKSTQVQGIKIKNNNAAETKQIKEKSLEERTLIQKDQLYQGISQTTQVSVRNNDDKRRLKLTNNIIVKNHNHNAAIAGIQRGNQNINTPSLYATLDGGAASLVGLVNGQRFNQNTGHNAAASGASISRSKI